MNHSSLNPFGNPHQQGQFVRHAPNLQQQQQQMLDQPMYGQQSSMHQQYTSQSQQPPLMYEPRNPGEAMGGEGTPNIANFGGTPEDGFNPYLSSTPPAGYSQPVEAHSGTQNAVSRSQATPSGAYRLLILVEGTQSLRRYWSVSLP